MEIYTPCTALNELENEELRYSILPNGPIPKEKAELLFFSEIWKLHSRIYMGSSRQYSIDSNMNIYFFLKV